MADTRVLQHDKGEDISCDKIFSDFIDKVLSLGKWFIKKIGLPTRIKTKKLISFKILYIIGNNFVELEVMCIAILPNTKGAD